MYNIYNQDKIISLFGSHEYEARSNLRYQGQILYLLPTTLLLKVKKERQKDERHTLRFVMTTEVIEGIFGNTFVIMINEGCFYIK